MSNDKIRCSRGVFVWCILIVVGMGLPFTLYGGEVDDLIKEYATAVKDFSRVLELDP